MSRWLCVVCEHVTRARVRPALCGECSAPDSYVITSSTPLGVVKALELTLTDPPRLCTGDAELDAALGGGIPRGSTVLVWGRGGSGKSRCSLRWATKIGATLAVTLEMNEALCASTARSAGADMRRLFLTTHELPEPSRAVRAIVYDSISRCTAGDDALRMLERWARTTGGVAFVICHANKGGDYRGPSTLQHWPDCELRLRGVRGQARVRVLKSRFCPQGSALVPLA